MLKQLYIKNFTLIDKLDIEFHQGFSVITGETGAGKSIILGAIGLLLGQRADSKAIKNGADKCIIEAHFDLSKYGFESFFIQNDIEYDANDCIIRRELTAAGKSRAFVNDTPVALSILKELGERLIDVHSQHQNLLLNKQDFQLDVVDILAQDEEQLNQYQTLFKTYQDTEKQLQQLEEQIAVNRQNTDFLTFQYNELKNADLKVGELEELEQRADILSHAEDIKSSLYEADNLLSGDNNGIVANIKSVANALARIEKVMPDTGDLNSRIDSCHIELKDIAQEISSMLETVEFDPSELDQVNIRLDKLYTLEKKFNVDSIDALIDQRENLAQTLNNIENSDDALNELRKQRDKAMQTCQTAAEALTKIRKQTAKTIEKEMRERLIPLGMPNVKFAVNIESTPLNRNGQDKVSFLFSANTSTPLQPVAQVASGGEIARVMLSLKAMISGAVKLPTIIFDEIDTGVSGKIAEKMAHIMEEMGQHERQVISITHLPQIAALGSTHYKVLKEETPQGTISKMTMLDTNQRIQEIAQMLSGSDITAAAISNAKELLKL